MVSAEGEEWYTVNSIKDHRVRRKRREYLVRWEGYDPEHDIWLPESEVSLLDAFTAYWKSVGLDPPPKPDRPNLD